MANLIKVPSNDKVNYMKQFSITERPMGSAIESFTLKSGSSSQYTEHQNQPRGVISFRYNTRLSKNLAIEAAIRHYVQFVYTGAAIMDLDGAL